MQTAFIASAEQNIEINQHIKISGSQLIKANSAPNTQTTAAPGIMESATVTDQRREETVCCGIGKYSAKIQIGTDPRNVFSVTYFVPENGEWQSKATDAFVILNGQFLTAATLADTPTDDSFAIYIAEKENKNVFIVGRREDSVRPGDDLGFMINITPETYKFDTYLAVLFAKMQTMSFHPGVSMNNINVTLLGYSMGGVQSTLYLESDYNRVLSYRGNVQKHIPVEIAIKFDPKKNKLAETQKNRYAALKQKWDSGIYHNDEMLVILYASSLAATDPNSASAIMPGLTNIEAWRMLMSKTYQFDAYPSTPHFHYISGNKNRLLKVDEQRVLNASLTAVPYSALSMDIFVAGMQGNIDGYDIDAGKINIKTLCIGVGGGFGSNACHWFKNEVGKNANVTFIEWGHSGHAGWLFDKNAKQLWDKIIAWDTKN